MSDLDFNIPIDKVTALQEICSQCDNSGLVKGEDKICTACDSFDKKYEICPNCDDTAIIPPGMTSDDCIVCAGKGILPRLQTSSNTWHLAGFSRDILRDLGKQNLDLMRKGK